MDKLTTSASEILRFIDDKVSPDYDMLEKTGEGYAEDARFVRVLTEEFAAAASRIAEAVKPGYHNEPLRQMYRVISTSRAGGAFTLTDSSPLS